MTRIRMRGLTDALRKLSELERKAGTGPRSILNLAMNDAVLSVHENVPGYPPKPSTSHYQRRGTLGRSVTTLVGEGEEGAISTVKKIGSEVVGVIGTAVVYAPNVIGDEQLDVFRRIGWYKLPNVVKDSAKDITQAFIRRVQREIRRIF